MSLVRTVTSSSHSPGNGMSASVDRYWPVATGSSGTSSGPRSRSGSDSSAVISSGSSGVPSWKPTWRSISTGPTAVGSIVASRATFDPWTSASNGPPPPPAAPAGLGQRFAWRRRRSRGRAAGDALVAVRPHRLDLGRLGVVLARAEAAHGDGGPTRLGRLVSGTASGRSADRRARPPGVDRLAPPGAGLGPRAPPRGGGPRLRCRGRGRGGGRGGGGGGGGSPPPTTRGGRGRRGGAGRRPPPSSGRRGATARPC